MMKTPNPLPVILPKGTKLKSGYVTESESKLGFGPVYVSEQDGCFSADLVVWESVKESKLK